MWLEETPTQVQSSRSVLHDEDQSGPRFLFLSSLWIKSETAACTCFRVHFNVSTETCWHYDCISVCLLCMCVCVFSVGNKHDQSSIIKQRWHAVYNGAKLVAIAQVQRTAHEVNLFYFCPFSLTGRPGTWVWTLLTGSHLSHWIRHLL